MSMINEGDKVRYHGKTSALLGCIGQVKKLHRDVDFAVVDFDGWDGPRIFSLKDLDVVDNKPLPLPG